MEIIIMLFVIVGMYLIGYITGFRECEDKTKELLRKLITECKEMEEGKVEKFKVKE